MLVFCKRFQALYTTNNSPKNALKFETTNNSPKKNALQTLYFYFNFTFKLHHKQFPQQQLHHKQFPQQQQFPKKNRFKKNAFKTK